jgi:DNA-directed RNA polymerase specialized sigma24 family protein
MTMKGASDFNDRWVRLRQMLVTSLRRQGAFDPEELAHESIARVLSNLHNGTPVQNLEAYMLQTASNVFREHRRVALRERPLIDDVPAEAPCPDLESISLALAAHKRRLLSGAEAELLEAYYPPLITDQIARRNLLAVELGVSANALRLKVSKIRRKLRKAIQS